MAKASKTTARRAAPTKAAPARKTTARRAVAPAPVVEAPVVETPVEQPAAKRGSVVRLEYKQRYAERGDARGCGDWLDHTLRAAFPQPLDVRAFEAMLDANGVRHAHWKKTNPGLLRMSGRMALAAKVAAAGELVLPGAKPAKAPAEFVAKHTH